MARSSDDRSVDYPDGGYRDEIRDLVEDIELFLEDVDVEAAHEKMQDGEFEEAWAMMGLTPKQAESIARSWYVRAQTILTRSGRYRR